MNMGLWESGTEIRRPWWEGRQKLLSFLLPNAGIMPPVFPGFTYREKELPMDFFSFHTYGFREKIYLERLRLMRECAGQKRILF